MSTMKIAVWVLGFAIRATLVHCFPFGLSPSPYKEEVSTQSALAEDRRQFFAHIVGTVSAVATAGTLHVSSSLALVGNDNEISSSDLTAQLFNEDGSLKQKMEMEPKFRDVQIFWDVSERFMQVVDGENSAEIPGASSIRVAYQLPEKWGNGNNLYIDQSRGAKACNRITVYRAGGNANSKQLERASTVGIAKSLAVTDNLKNINTADLIGGRLRITDGQKYYEFDMATAPSTCDSSNENLGLGFCPYESIYLLSSTIFEDRLYVFALECDKSEWKIANSDLRRVRSSFTVSKA